MNTPRSAAVTPEAAWAVVKARELNEDLDSRDYFDAGYKAGEEARQKLEIQLAQKDQIYLDRLDAFEQVTKRAEAAEAKASTLTVQGLMARIVEAEAKSGDAAKLRTYLVGRRNTIEASIASEMLAGNEWKEKCERTALAEITALEAALASVPAETHQVTDICVCHLAYQPHPFVVGTICDAKSETGKANVWLRNDGQWTQDETSPECYLKIGSWNPPPPQVDATLEPSIPTWAVEAAKAINAEEWPGDDVVATIIAAHARKSQPGVNEKILNLLKVAACPNCDGSGGIIRGERTLVSRDMATDAGIPELEGSVYSEPEVEQCQWCDERTEAIAAAESAAPGASVNEELKKCLWLMLDGTKPDYSDSRSSLSTRQANINRAWGAYEAAARKTEGAK